jgi:hypothetical protein
MNTTHTTTSVPALNSNIADLMDDLTGFHPILDRLVATFGELLTADLDASESGDAVAVLGSLDGGSVATLLGLVVRHLADPDANPALAGLPVDRKQTLRRLGAEYAAEIDNSYLRGRAAEASAVIEGI